MTSTIGLSTDSRPRWRVAVLSAPDESLETLRAAITEAGGLVTIEAPPRAESLSFVTNATPDVVVLRPSDADAKVATHKESGPVGRPAGRRMAGQRPDLTPFASLACPVVLFTSDTSRALLKLAAAAGVSAFVLEPVQPAQVAPTFDLAVARFGDAEALRRKLADRKVIERAKGRLMAALGIPEDDAFRRLRTQAMHTRSTLGDAARSVLTTGAEAAASTAPGDAPEARRFRPATPAPRRFAPSLASVRSHWRTAPIR